MKFICEKNTILREMIIAQDIISSKSFDIKSNVYLIATDNNELTIKATDLKIHFEVKVPLEVIEAGSTTVSADKLLKILNSLSTKGTITFSLDNNILSIIPEFDNVDVNLKCVDPDNYPEFRQPEANNSFELSQKDFQTMFIQVLNSVSTDESRYFLTGIYMEKKNDKLIMVSTDGKRLSYTDLEINVPDFSPIIIPVKILKIIQKLASGEGNIKINIEKKVVYFDFDNNHFYSTLIEGNFPDYEKVIPNEFIDQMVLSKDELTDALKRISILTEEKSGKMEFTFAPESLKIQAKESNYGDAKQILAGENFTGEEISLEFNYNFFLDALREINGKDKVELVFPSNYKPLLMRPYPSENYFHVFMPMTN